MKTIIAGGRDFDNYMAVAQAVACSGFKITEVISGRCLGVDRLGEKWARPNGIPIKPFPANWKPDGPNGRTDKSAGPKRNIRMAYYAEALIAIWDGKSPSTGDMITKAEMRGLRVYIHRT